MKLFTLLPFANILLMLASVCLIVSCGGGGTEKATLPMPVIVTPPVVTPTITNYSPSNGTVGTVVTITGTNFGTNVNAVTVNFGNSGAVKPSVVTATSMTVTVPSDASSGNLIVSVGGVGTTIATIDFTVNVTYKVLYLGGSFQSVDLNYQIINGGFDTYDPITFYYKSLNITAGGSLKMELKNVPGPTIASEFEDRYTWAYHLPNTFKKGDTPPSVATLAQDTLTHPFLKLTIDKNNQTILFPYEQSNLIGSGYLGVALPTKNLPALDLPTLIKVFTNSNLRFN